MAEIRRIIDEAYMRAKKTLTDYRDQWRPWPAGLLEYESLTGEGNPQAAQRGADRPRRSRSPSSRRRPASPRASARRCRPVASPADWSLRGPDPGPLQGGHRSRQADRNAPISGQEIGAFFRAGPDPPPPSPESSSGHGAHASVHPLVAVGRLRPRKAGPTARPRQFGPPGWSPPGRRALREPAAKSPEIIPGSGYGRQSNRSIA